MKRFIARHSDRILGVLSGFDRLVFRGTVRRIAYVDGLAKFLNSQGILLKHFAEFAKDVTARVKTASEFEAVTASRPIVYLESGREDKERVALRIAERDGVERGLIAVIQCVEPCVTFDIHRNRSMQRLELVSRLRKCLHSYHYAIDPEFGLMNARIQTWLPFNIQVCVNGREWLARQMDRVKLGYRRWDNSFVGLQDVKHAQRLMRQQLQARWDEILDRIALRLNPAHGDIFGDGPLGYYWSTYQSEWATDVMFRSAEELAEIYPAVVLHAMTTFASPDVMRFLGRRVRSDFSGEIVSDFKDRAEGVRVKHRVGANSIKSYDKLSILRVETTINRPEDFRVFRAKEGGPENELQWRPMRQGIADLHRRAQVSQGANERYLDAFAALDSPKPLGALLHDVCQPTKLGRRRVRALRPWTDEDVALLTAIARGEFNVKGFRNRDLVALLFECTTLDPVIRRRQSSRATRQLRLLRAHGLIRKLGNTRRYVLSKKGQDVIPAMLAAQRVSLQQLQRAAA